MPQHRPDLPAAAGTAADIGARPLTEEGGRAGGDAAGGGRESLAGSYGRKSDPNEELVEDQHRYNAERATRDRFVLPDRPGYRWGDDHTSGALTARDGLDALIAHVTSGRAQFRRLYVRNRDRLARADDPRFIFYLEYLLKAHGVEVCYSTDAEHIDYENGADNGRMTGQFVTAAVENVRTAAERRETRRRSRIGSRSRVAKKFFVGSRAPYGTERWLASRDTGALVQRVPETGTLRVPGHAYKLRWNEDRRAAVRLLFELLEQGRSVRAVARALTDVGHPPPGAAGWTERAVWEIARNPLYKGDLHFGRTRHATPATPADTATLSGEGALYVSDYLPDAPISAAQWDVVQRILNGHAERQQRRRASRPDFLLTGLVICADCGEALHGHTQPPRQESAERRRMYRHNPSRRRGGSLCRHTNRYVPAEPLEAMALEATTHALTEGLLVRLAQEEIARRAAETRTPSRTHDVDRATAQVAKLSAACAKASRLAAEAESEEEEQVHKDTGRRLAAELQAAKDRVRSLETERDHLAAAEARLPALEARLVELREVFARNAPDERKRVVQAVVQDLQLDLALDAVKVRVRAF